MEMGRSETHGRRHTKGPYHSPSRTLRVLLPPTISTPLKLYHPQRLGYYNILIRSCQVENEETEYIPTLKLVNDYITNLKLIGKSAVKQVGSMTVYGSIEAGASDDDVIVYVDEADIGILENLLASEGFDNENEYGTTGDGKFTSHRRGLNNIIVTTDLDYFDLYALANDVVEELQLFNKEHRIMVFSAIIDREFVDNRPQAQPRADPQPQAPDRIRREDFQRAVADMNNGVIFRWVNNVMDDF